MAKTRVKRLTDYLRDLLEQRGVEVDRIILFGSYVKGKYRKDSDVDIVVISKSFKGKGIFERAKMLGDVEWKLMEKFLIPLDIVTMTPEDFKRGVSPVAQYARGGEVIFKK